MENCHFVGQDHTRTAKMASPFPVATAEATRSGTPAAAGSFPAFLQPKRKIKKCHFSCVEPLEVRGSEPF